MITRHVASSHSIPQIPDQSVHLIVESAPYYWLRNYEGEQVTDWPGVELNDPFGGSKIRVSPMACALGWEPEPIQYLAHLILCLREHHRILRDDGVLFFNLGDKWADRPFEQWGVKGKEALMLPQRLAMLAQADGWFVRHASIPWLKMNGLPNSNQDRFVVAHEDIMMLTKTRKYSFYPDSLRRDPASYNKKGGRANYTANGSVRHGLGNGSTLHQMSDQGRLCRTSDVWVESVQAIISQLDEYSTQLRRVVSSRADVVCDGVGNLSGFLVNTQQFKGQHYAGWPEKLVELFIRAGTSDAGCCPQCGTQWVWEADEWKQGCGCPPNDPSPSIVGDFFAGSGTSGRVAVRLRRMAILADISREYMIGVSNERLSNIQMQIF